MFDKPILIIGAPRSGTSMLQKIFRGHPEVWSLPSESDPIWDKYCHPALHNWSSEVLGESDVTSEAIEEIQALFKQYICPASTWRSLENKGLIWGFNRKPIIRKMLKPLYSNIFPIVKSLMVQMPSNVRMVEKTASNCFRLGYVNEVFPDAKIIYPVRDGRNNISSIINGWLHPKRFFTYDVPVPLKIKGYPYSKWNFVLPEGWRDYIDKPLEDVCAFQWRACHESMLAETSKEKYKGRVLRIKLEALSEDPEYWLRELCEFIELPYDQYFQNVAKNLPVVNSPDMNTARDKWKKQNRERIENIEPQISEMMARLGYAE
jgi:hypothetical protein